MAAFDFPSRKLTWFLGLTALAASAMVLAADPRSRVLATNTLVLSAVVGTASVALGAPLAILLVRTDVFGRAVCGALLAAMLFVPLYLQATAWQAGFGTQGWFTLAASGRPLLDGWRGAILIHIAAAIPWAVAIVAAGLSLAEPDVEEMALLDAGPLRVLVRVTLRRAASALAAAFLWVAVATAGEVTVTDLFQVRTYAEQIYTEAAIGDPWDAAPWRAMPSLLAALWVVVAGLVLSHRLINLGDPVPHWHRSVFRLGRLRRPASGLLIALVGLLIGIPADSLIVKAGTVVTRAAEGFERSWSLWQCLRMVVTSPVRFSDELVWSLVIGIVAATTAVLIGLPLAWLTRQGGWRVVPAWLTVAATIALPGPLIGLAIITLFNSSHAPLFAWMYDRTIVPVWLAQTVRALPVCMLVLWYALRSVPAGLVEGAVVDGAGTLRLLSKVVVPACWPAILIAWLAALAVAWGELSASILVVPPGVSTLPIAIFGLIHYGVDDQVAGLALAVMLKFVAIALLLTAILHRRRGRQRDARL